MKSVFIFCMTAVALVAQDASSGGGDTNETKRISAVSQFFDHDFVNVYGYANGVWDSRVPDGQNASGQEIYGGGFGWEAGGGITASHSFKDGGFTVNYRGGYRDYQSSSSGTGQEQSLSLGYSKKLNRHWTFGADILGGILTSGSSFYAATSLESNTPGNPFSLESRFANATLNLSYMQTHRLSYVFTGNFLYNGYVAPKNLGQNPFYNPVSTRGVTGGVSVLYRLTPRDTVGVSYSRSHYGYSGKSGIANIDLMSLTYSRIFPDHWQLDLSGGVNRSASAGIALTPVEFEILGSPVLAVCYCPFNRTIYSPAYQGVLTHSYLHSSFSVSGGQSILAGNGLYLTSRDQFVNGAFSYSTRRTNVSLGGNFSRLSSVSTAALGQTYSYYGVSGSYGVNVVRYVSANFRLDLLHYNNIFVGTSTGFTANEVRASFGLSVSRKSVPLTLF